ncbi:MAG: endonuclease MutS2 [Ignavibacteriales bacterium]|nr:MAG: endonuclease MutS2 [Ignavibacteriales bacterium]
MISQKALEKLEFNKVLENITFYTFTELGKIKVLEILPFEREFEAVNRGELISEAKEVLIRNDIPPFEYLPNITEAIKRTKVEGVFLQTKDILEILKLAKLSRSLFTFFKEKEYAPLLSNETKILFVDKVFEHYFNNVFTDSGDIRDNASPKLNEIRKEINEKGEQLRKLVNRILKKYSESYLVQEEYITLREGRIVIPVKAEHKRHVKGFIHSESNTGQTVYIEPEETLELNNEILSLKFAEQREIERILRNLTVKISEYASNLLDSLQIITNLDLVFAAARYSIEVIGSFPTVQSNKPLHIIDARHPQLLKKFGRENTIPLSVKVDNENVLLITGPNAGGKTVVLKTIGLLSAMVASGLHIPCDPDSNFYFFEKILIDMGDEQSIDNDLSTFSSHLSNIKSIINEADDRSLILLDEIGTGTDPIEGAALAIAILIQLQKNDSKVFATTHHGSVKIAANDLAGFQNSSMEFDADNLQPTYRFTQGLPGSSYAFEIAERLGFTKQFIELANNYLDSDKNKIEQFLTDLEQKSKKYKSKLDEIERENARLKGLTNLYQEKISKLEEQKRKIISEAQQKAEIYLHDVNKKIETAIKNIRESNASKDVVKTERKQIEEIKKVQNTFKKQKEIESIDKAVELGSYAKVKGTETYGIVTEVNKGKNKASLQVGNLKLQVKYSELISTKRKDFEEKSYIKPQYQTFLESETLDIRGDKPEDAEFKVIRFLDEAYSANSSQVEILHGKGTGALKKTVHDLLKQHEHVKNFYFAKIEFGGEGITIVELE